MVIPFPRGVFRVGGYDGQHQVNDPNCTTECCNAGASYPQRCVCGGLIHCAQLDQGDSYYGTPEITRCDRCGDNARAVSDMIGGVHDFLKDACIRELRMPFTIRCERMLVDHTDFCKGVLIRELGLPINSDWEAIHYALETPDPAYEEYPSKYKRSKKGGSGGIELCRRLHARQLSLPADATWRDIERGLYRPKFVTLRVGTFFSRKLLMAALQEKVDLSLSRGSSGIYAAAMLKHDFPIERGVRDIELVLVRSGLLVSDADREAGTERKLPIVRGKGLECGLELCPPETALQMLIQDKVNRGQWLKVMSQPILAEEKTLLSNGTWGRCLPSGEYNYRMFGVGVHEFGEAVLYASDPEGRSYTELGDYNSEALVFMRSPSKKLCLPEWVG